MGFSEQLKKARANLGLTQQQVADLMGITKSTYCGYETGKRQPDVLKIKKLANILNTSGDILLETGFKENIVQNDTNETEFKANQNSQALQEVLSQLEKMNDEQIRVVLAFINSLDDIKNSFSNSDN